MISICEDLRKSVLQAAIQGRLPKQLSEDGDAETLYAEIQKEKQKLIKEGKIKKEKPLPEISEDDIPFDIPENWKWVRLKEIVYNNGQITPFETFSYIDIGSIDNIHQKLNQIENIIEPDKAPSRARKIVKQGDILYSTVRPYLHNMCIVDKAFSHTPIASTGFAVMSCFNGVENRFLFYYLLSPDFDAYANATDNAKGVAYPAINDEKLYKAIVPLPPPAEQKRIVARVDELMKRIDEMEKTEKDITALYDAFPGDMKASLLQAAIQGKLTEQLASDGDAETLYADIQKEKQRLIKEGKIKKEKPLPEITDDDIPFDIPENWKWVRFGTILECYGGLSYKKENLDIRSDSMVTVFRGGNILNNKYVFKGDDVRIAREFVGNSSLFLRKNQLITPAVTSLENLGKVAYIDKSFNDVVAGGFVLNLVPYFDNEIFSKYLHSVLTSGYMKEIFLSIVNKSGQAFYNISKPKLLSTIIPIPPLAEQKRIVEKLDQLLPLCDSMKEAIDA